MSSDAASIESSATSFSCSAAASRPDAGWRRDHLYAEDLLESSVAHAFLVSPTAGLSTKVMPSMHRSHCEPVARLWPALCPPAASAVHSLSR